MNNKFFKKDIREITTEFLKEVIDYSYAGGHKSHAPLGCSGDTFMLYGESRRREISLRLHSGDVKMLITNNSGSFLFYGGFDTSLLPISFIAKQYYSVIQNVYYLLDSTSTKSAITQHDKEEMFESKNIFSNLFGLHCL